MFRKAKNSCISKFKKCFKTAILKCSKLLIFLRKITNYFNILEHTIIKINRFVIDLVESLQVAFIFLVLDVLGQFGRRRSNFLVVFLPKISSTREFYLSQK